MTIQECKAIGAMVGLLAAMIAMPAAAQDEKEPATAPDSIGRQEAPVLAAERFNALFGGLYWRHPLDGDHYAFDSRAAADFRVTGKDRESWHVAYEPLVGPAVHARVDRSSGLVQFNRISIATE